MASFTSKLQPFSNSLLHAVVGLVLFAVPLYLSQHTAVADLSVSGVVMLVLKYVDEKYGK